jgi:hypothetical protein
MATLLGAACSRSDQSHRAGTDTAARADTSSPDTASFDDPIDPQTGLGQSCEFVKTLAHPKPDALLHEFLRRAAAGEFAEAEEWLPAALDCPGHEPGHDIFSVVRSYSAARLDSVRDTVRYTLSRPTIGFRSSARFYRELDSLHDTVTLYHTRFGWRIKSPAPWDWIAVENALARRWLRPADTAGRRN